MKGMVEERGLLNPEINIENILKLAKESHENYLVRATDKDLEKAIDYYIEAINIDPSVSEAYYKLAGLLWEKGQIDIDSALAQCEKAIELEPNSCTGRLYYAYFLKAAGKFAEAETQFKKSIKLAGIASSKPRIALGHTILQQLDKTSSDLQKMISGVYYLVTGYSLAPFDLSHIRFFWKSLFDEISVINYKINGAICKKLKKYDKAEEIYQNAAEHTGKIDLFYTKIGNIAVETGKYGQAVEYYKNVLRLSPNNATLWAKLANILQKHYNNQIDDLIDCYLHLAELDTTNPRVYYELGHLYLRNDDKYNAISSFKKSTELDPENAFYHNSLAYTLVQVEDFEGAILEYQKAIQINPDNEWTSVVCQALAAIYQQVKNNIDAAIVSYQSSVVLDPNNTDAYIALGEIYHDQEDLNAAIDAYCQAVKRNASSPRVYCNLGLALWEKDYIEESVIAYQKAIDADQTYDIAYNNLGVVYLDGVNDIDEAIRLFDEAIQLNPNYALAYYNKGRALEQTTNKTATAECYQMALDLNKFTQEIDEEDIEKKLFNLFKV